MSVLSGVRDVRPDMADRRLTMLIMLCFCVVLSLATWFSTSAVLPQLKEQFALSDAVTRWLGISVQLGFLIGAIGSTTLGLSDRISPRTLMIWASVAGALLNIGILIVSEPWQLIVLRVLSGAALAGVYPPSLKLISTWFITGRGIAMGSVVGALTLGSALPHLVNGLGGLDWQVVIVITTLLPMISAGVIAIFVAEGPYPFPETKFDARKLGDVLSNKVFLLATIGYLGHMWELYAMWSWLLFLARERFVDMANLASMLTFTVIAVGAPACILAGYLADKVGRIPVVVGSLVLSGVCAAVIGFAFEGSPELFAIIAIVWGASVVADSAQFSAIVSERCDKRFVGTALTAQLGLGYALTLVTTWFLPAVSDYLGGWQWAFLVLVPGPVVGIIAMWKLRKL